jgi:hypothetical protein
MNSSFAPYLLSNNTFVVLWEYVLFELQLFENFQQQDGCDPKGM